MHPTQIHQPAWTTEAQNQPQNQPQNQQPQQPQTLSSIAHVQEMHENNSETNNLSHNSSEDDFQHLFSSPLKFLAVLNEPQSREQQQQQHNIDLETAASDLGVVPFDVEDSYYNPLTSTPSVSQPHILRKSNSLGIIHRRKRENVSI